MVTQACVRVNLISHDLATNLSVTCHWQTLPPSYLRECLRETNFARPSMQPVPPSRYGRYQGVDGHTEDRSSSQSYSSKYTAIRQNSITCSFSKNSLVSRRSNPPL